MSGYLGPSLNFALSSACLLSLFPSLRGALTPLSPSGWSGASHISVHTDLRLG